MKYKQIIIITTIVLIGSQRNIFAQNPSYIDYQNAKTDTLYDIEKHYKLPSSGFDVNINIDSLEFTERRIPKIRKIFKAGKVYYYKAIYIASNNHTLSNSNVIMKATGERWEWQPEKQDLVYYEFPNYKADSIKLRNHDINKELQLWKNQTGEGVIENFERVWMHPIRINQYKFTEIAPFPAVQFPLIKGKKWGNTTMIDEGWGEWNGETVEYKYKITGRTTFQLDDFQIDCWIIKSASKCSLGKSKLTTYFNDEYGFVKMIYKNYKNEKLVFELIKVEE
ncbi:MAG: hypothetical protein ACK5KP_02725 [Paludibacteraceae bacterium]